MDSQLLQRIRFGHAKDAIRQLAGQCPKEADLRAAAELLADDPKWIGIDIAGALADILAEQQRAGAEIAHGFACQAIAAKAQRCADELGTHPASP